MPRALAVLLAAILLGSTGCAVAAPRIHAARSQAEASRKQVYQAERLSLGEKGLSFTEGAGGPMPVAELEGFMQARGEQEPALLLKPRPGQKALATLFFVESVAGLALGGLFLGSAGNSSTPGLNYVLGIPLAGVGVFTAFEGVHAWKDAEPNPQNAVRYYNWRLAESLGLEPEKEDR